MKPQLIKLGDRLRSLRRKAHKSQYELADEWRALGVPITRDMIANWETNRAQIPARFIPLIAFSLNAGVADLLPDLRISAFADLQRLCASVGASRKSTNHRTRAPKRHTRRTPAGVISKPAKSRRQQKISEMQTATKLTRHTHRASIRT